MKLICCLPWPGKIIIQCTHTNSENFKFLRSTVYYVLSRFKELSTSQNSRKSGKPRTARTQKFIIDVRETIKRNLKSSARQMTKDRNVSTTSMRNIFKNDLQLSFPTMWEIDNTSNLPKILQRSTLLLWGTDNWHGRARDRFFWLKTLHIWSDCKQSEWHNLRKIFSRHWWLRENSLPPIKSRVSSLCRLQSPNLGSHLYFHREWG